MRPFITRYPAFLAGSAEFRDIQEALEPELLELWAARDSALAQLCVETASWGLRYWERTLGLPAEAGKDLEARRSRVRSRLMGADVSTVSLVESIAEIWSGQRAEVTEHANEFCFEIRFMELSGVLPNIRDINASIRELIPAHLQWEYDLCFSVYPFRSGSQRDFLLRRFLMLSMRFSHLRGSVVRWDGSVDYDGEILFDQVPMGIRLPAMRFCIRLRELRSRSIRWDGSVLHDGTIDFGQQIGGGGSPSFGVRLRAPHALAASVPELRMGGGIAHPPSARVSRSVFAAPCSRHTGRVDGAVTMDNWRGMDGGLSFDGTYKFDAYLKKEEL